MQTRKSSYMNTKAILQVLRWDWGIPLVRPALGYPQKGPGTRDLGKNLGLGYRPLWTDIHLWKQYLPQTSVVFFRS